MPTVAHKNLTGTDLHEPKGVAAAAADKVYVSNGAGSGTWQKLDKNQLAGTGNPFGAQLFHIQDQQTAGTNGGTLTLGAWQTRVLNTSVVNEIASASLASNQITLPAGTYFIMASAPGHNVGNHKAKLRNITDGADTLIGTASVSDSSSPQTCSDVHGRFTIAGTKVFELQHRSTATGLTNGLGAATNVGVIEIYAEVMIWKVG